MTFKNLKNNSKTKLDKYDKKIITELIINSRIAKSQIAKKLGISIQRLEYKYNKLFENTIKPVMILNYSMLDVKEYLIFAKKLSDKTIEKLRKSNQIFFLAEIIGETKYIFYILTNNISEFKKKYLKNDIIKTYVVNDSLNDIYNPYELKIDEKRINKSTKLTNVILKKEDYKILYELYQTPLENYIKLSNKTQLDWRTIKTRICKMLESGIIDRFKIAFDPFQLGYLFYFLKITTPETYKSQIKRIIRQDTFSGFLFDSNDELLMMYMPPSHNKLSEFSKKIENLSKNIVIDINQVINFQISTNPQFILEEFKRKSK